jgi:hypothetical protein
LAGFFSCFFLLRIVENLKEKKVTLFTIQYEYYFRSEKRTETLHLIYFCDTSGSRNKIMSIEMIIMNPQRSDWSLEEDVSVQHKNLSTRSKQNNGINDLDNNESKKSK